MLKFRRSVLALMLMTTAAVAGAQTLQERWKALTPDQQAQIKDLNTKRKAAILSLIQARIASVKGKEGDDAALAQAKSDLMSDIRAVNQTFIQQAEQVAAQK